VSAEEMAALCTSLSVSSLSFTSSRSSCASRGSEPHTQAGAVRLVRALQSGALVGRHLCECPGWDATSRWPSRPRETLSSWPCGARRKESTTTKPQEEVLDDEDLRAGLNEVIGLQIKCWSFCERSPWEEFFSLFS
jgi:hypothetical protein